MNNSITRMSSSLKKLIMNLIMICLILFSISSLYSASGSQGFEYAGQEGVLNIGDSSSSMSIKIDSSLNKDVQKLNYFLSDGSAAGIWMKEFPNNINSDNFDILEAGSYVNKSEHIDKLAIKIEIKGTKDIQVIPIETKNKWNFIVEDINWQKIGDLNEIVFVVSKVGIGDSIEGVVYFDFSFCKQPLLQKLGASILWRVLAVILISLVFALCIFYYGKIFSKMKNRKPVLISRIISSRVIRDIIYGISFTLIIVIALNIFYAGKIGFSLNNWWFVIICAAGVLPAELLKFSITGRHLKASEAFQNVLITGLLAASSSTQMLLQAPYTWSEILVISNFTAAVFCLLYHIVNSFKIISTGKNLNIVQGLLMTCAPYLMGWLLTLESSNLITAIGKILTIGVSDTWSILISIILGRIIIIFVFNEIICNSIRLITGHNLLKNIKAHLMLLYAAALVSLSPEIANFGSGIWIASLSNLLRYPLTIIITIAALIGLWAEVYLITGMVMDGIHGIHPTYNSSYNNIITGIKKGSVYSGMFIAILNGINIINNNSQWLFSNHPLITAAVAGALAYPLIKTIIETFDGSTGFFARMRLSYSNLFLYIRGAVIGFGGALLITQSMFQMELSRRFIYGMIVGVAASSGVNILRDFIYMLSNKGKIQTWRVYFVDGLLGGFIGGAIAFYLDTPQVEKVIDKLSIYCSAGKAPQVYSVYPFLNKWGFINLGKFTGGVRLFFNEAVAGVINWSIAAWLFAINRAFLTALFQRDKGPIKQLFTKNGFVQLIKHMIEVLRWGLWMSPIINSFLRMMMTPTWYNQDGAIRTLIAIFKNITLSTEDFNAWSLKVFIALLAFGWFRIIIWLDHMGLRIATLVNLSFLGMDKLDEKVSKFIGRSAAARYIPEGVKRFTTWAPLLIPFYIPQGRNWDYAWTQSETIQNAVKGNDILSKIQLLSLPSLLLLIFGSIIVISILSFLLRILIKRNIKQKKGDLCLRNNSYEIILKNSGEIYSRNIIDDHDITRRSYDSIEPCGRTLFLVDMSMDKKNPIKWPVVGNFPIEYYQKSEYKIDDSKIKIENKYNEIKTDIEIQLPDINGSAEIWSVKLKNTSKRVRKMKLVPYMEWVLDNPMIDRGHTQYNRLFPEMEYDSRINAILAWQKHSKRMGFISSNIAPEGFLTSRIDFIGRAQSIWSPRVLKTLSFLNPANTSAYPTFDPIGSLLINLTLKSGEEKEIKFIIGLANDKAGAVSIIKNYLKPKSKKIKQKPQKRKTKPLIGHGEILPGTPQPYYSYSKDGNKLLIHTPFTPRPYDHALSNSAGHYITLTNRGLHTSSNGNAQMNRITPDWADTVTREVPSEAIYLFDKDQNEWFSPTYHPLNDNNAEYKSEFGVDGTAVYRMKKSKISSELTVFIPPDEPVGIYLLKIKNNDKNSRSMRIGSYFQIVLADQPEHSGPLDVKFNKKLNTLFFKNPRNSFCKSPVFVSISISPEIVETKRGKFFGIGRSVSHPYIVETGKSDKNNKCDNRPIAGLIGEMKIPAQGEFSISILVGQCNNKKASISIIRKYQKKGAILKSLEVTRKWWLDLMGTSRIETNQKEFNNIQNWLKYQALAERIWARRGFYQTSGAYGFRDQLQDTVNLIWIEPAFARKQIILHASQQFIEGDVVHWFHVTKDGRTAFANRSYASDNLLWLVWGLVEYIRMTGDNTILEEKTTYLRSEQPLVSLPKGKHGLATNYLRSTRSDTIYKHCIKSIDLVLEKRMGVNGIPLILCGDWNDGLDEIGSAGKGESIWLGLFLYYIMDNMIDIIETKEGIKRKEYYLNKMKLLKDSIENTWRSDRYLRAIHDDGTEIGIKGSGIWEIDALTAAWAVISGINMERGIKVFNTAIKVLEKENAVLLGWPALREDTKPYLGRSSKYPEGVRENGSYSHGVQWLIRAARLLTEYFMDKKDTKKAIEYREIAYRLWMIISPVSHVKPDEIELYGGQPNKQAADLLTTYDCGRMIWNGYTGAAGWLFREMFEGVIGAGLKNNKIEIPEDIKQLRGNLRISRIYRNISGSPIKKEGN